MKKPKPSALALAAAGKPDITYNPTGKTIPFSTYSLTAAKRIAREGGQKSAFNHR